MNGDPENPPPPSGSPRPGPLDSSGRARSLPRGVDAGLNRLGEALRTIEDRLRFDRRVPVLPRRWKALRHEVGALRRAIEDRWGPTALYRDVAGDPGHPDRNPDGAAPHRGDDDVLAANLARAREASRSIEEALRTIEPEWATQAERIRYAIYEAESATRGFLHRADRLLDVRLYVLLTTHLASRPPLETAELAIRGGAQMIQLREKEMEGRELLALARDLRALTAAYGVPLVVNDRVEIAALSEADGVHLGQGDLPPVEARRLLGPRAIIGLSTHAVAEAENALDEGSDYIGVGPIHPTRTKEHRRAVGLEYIRLATSVTPLPGFAIGSVNRDTLAGILEAGARRIAVCTGIIAREDIEGEARWFRTLIDAAVARSPVRESS